MTPNFIRISSIFLFSLLLLVLPGCLDIEEEVFLNKDGSGTYVNTMDLSGLVDMIMMMTPDSVKEEIGADPDRLLDSLFQSQEMASAFASFSGTYGDVEGISNVQSDLGDGKLRISYDFATIDALNEALSSTEDQGMGMSTPFFTWKKGKLVRGIAEESSMMDEELESQIEMAKMMMGNASYKVRYHFPGRMKSSESSGGSTTNGGKTVEFEYSLLEIMEDPTILENEMKFKRR